MSDYIKRESVLELAWSGKIISNDNFKTVRELLQSIPAADVRPVVRGMWLTQEYMYGTEDQEDCWIERKAEEGDTAYCSICRKTAGIDEAEDYVLSNFCPNCGADMRGEGSND